RTCTWRPTPPSWIFRKPALPKSRRATTRPATRSAGASASAASSSSPKRAWTSAARWSGRKSFGYGVAPCARRAPSFRRWPRTCWGSSGRATRSKLGGFYWVRRSRSRNDRVAGVEDEEGGTRARADQIGDHRHAVVAVGSEGLELLDHAADRGCHPRQREDLGRHGPGTSRRHRVRRYPVEPRRHGRPDEAPEEDHVSAAHGLRREPPEGSAARGGIAGADEQPEGARRGEEEALLAALIERGPKSDQRPARARRIEAVEPTGQASRSAAALPGEEQHAGAATEEQPRLVVIRLRHEREAPAAQHRRCPERGEAPAARGMRPGLGYWLGPS